MTTVIKLRPGEKHLQRLERRASHLEARIAASLTKDLTYDKAELASIRWVVKYIEETQVTTNKDKG